MSTTADTRWHPTEEHFALLAAVLDMADEGHLSELEAVVYGLGYCPGTWGVLQHLTSAAGLARFWHHSEGGAELVGELALHLLKREWGMSEWEELAGHIALRLELPLCHREGLSLALSLIAVLSLETLEDMREEPAGAPSYCTACREWGGLVHTAGPETELCPECLALHEAAEVELCPACLEVIAAGEGFLCPECLADVEAEEKAGTITDLRPTMPAELAELVTRKLEELGLIIETEPEPGGVVRVVSVEYRADRHADEVTVPWEIKPYVDAVLSAIGAPPIDLGEVG